MKVRYRMEGFSFYDYDNIAIHLEKMVQKGWMAGENLQWILEISQNPAAEAQICGDLFLGSLG